MSRDGDAVRECVEVPGLREGLAVEEVQTRLRVFNRMRESGHRGVAFFLWEMESRGLHQLSGHASAAHYAGERLEMSRKMAVELVRVGRALQELTVVDEAFRKGELSWSKTRELTRVATPENQSAWIERAKKLSCRRLEKETARARRGDRPPDGNVDEEELGLPRPKFKATIQLGTLAQQAWERLRQVFQEDKGRAVGDDELGEELVLAFVGLMDASTRKKLPPIFEKVRASAFKVEVHECSRCLGLSVEGEDGPERLDEAAQARLRGVEIERMRAKVDEAVGDEPDDGVGAEREKDRPTPSWLRKRVLARDGFRCRSCERRADRVYDVRKLHAHHVVFRSKGGPTTLGNCMTLCLACHALIHAGLLRIEGTGDGAVRFLDREGRVRERGGGAAPRGAGSMAVCASG